MNTITKKACRTIRADLDAALAQVAEKHGVNIKIGTMRYTDSRVDATVSVETIAEGGITMTKEAERLQLDGPFIFTELDDPLGATFEFRGDTYTMIGLRQRNAKQRVIARCESNGNRYTFTVAAVKAALPVTA